ncbi:MAG: hypothetical protein OEY29_00090 [Gammaproteobacteria bacterium]|nr:hypothetical protein [Gammaproteobacteria bacterium]
MDELEELFEEFITFESEIANNDPENCTYPDKIKAMNLFDEYLEWRLDKIHIKPYSCASQ